MRWTMLPLTIVGLIALLLAGCGGSASAGHPSLDEHGAKPKRLEAIIEIDLNEFVFADPTGAENPTFTLPVGKTVGIHLHNEGKIVHELMIGRGHSAEGEYAELLTEAVPSDVFFYYGDQKTEVGGALFEELEVEQGIRDTWIRITVPAEMAGEWEIGCFIEGHYDQGMHAKLVFQ
jgi:uncharacterized cupredoxin-like copper-binding protein